MFIGLYCCLLVRMQPLSLAWADLHHTDSLWTLFQGPIVEFWLDYLIFYLGTSEIFPSTTFKWFSELKHPKRERETKKARRDSREYELEAHTSHRTRTPTPDRTTEIAPQITSLRSRRCRPLDQLSSSQSRRRLKPIITRPVSSPMTHPWPISLSLNLPLPFSQFTITLSSSLSQFDRIFEFNEWFCSNFCFFKFIYWNFLLQSLFGSWENVRN